MFSSLKRLVKQSLVYGIGYSLTRFIGFLLLPLYTNCLPTEEYGVAALVFTFLAISNVIFTLGLNTAFLRFFVLADTKEEKKTIFSTVYLSTIFTTVLFAALLFIFSPHLSRLIINQARFSGLIRLSSGILLFDTFSIFPLLILRGEQQSGKFIKISLANVITSFTLNILFIVHLNWGVEAIFRANLIASAVTFLLLSPIIRRYFNLSFSGKIYKELLKFGLPYIPATLSVTLMDLIDRILLGKLTDTGTVGIYNAGYKLGMIMALVVSGFRFAWHPFFLSISKREEAKEVFSKVLTYFLLLTGFIFLAVSFFIDDIVRFRIFGFTVFGPNYWNATQIVPLILISYAFYGIYVNFLVGIYLKKKTQYLPFITGLGAIVNIIGNLLLIPRLGMMGAAYSTLGAYLLMTSLLYFFSQLHYPIRYEWGRLAKIGAVCVLLFYLGQLGSSLCFPTWGFRCYKIALLIFYPLSLLFIRFFYPLELNKIKQRWSKRGVSPVEPRTNGSDNDG
jgi:O-antigen/teichoic acid export membrane protein